MKGKSEAYKYNILIKYLHNMHYRVDKMQREFMDFLESYLVLRPFQNADENKLINYDLQLMPDDLKPDDQLPEEIFYVKNIDNKIAYSLRTISGADVRDVVLDKLEAPSDFTLPKLSRWKKQIVDAAAKNWHTMANMPEWEDQDTDEYLKLLRENVGDLTKYIAGKKLKFPLDNSIKTEKLVIEVEEKLREIVEPLRIRLSNASDIKGDKRDEIIDSLASAYVFALSSELFNSKNSSSPKPSKASKAKEDKHRTKMQRYSQFINMVRDGLFKEDVHQAYLDQFTMNIESRRFNLHLFHIDKAAAANMIIKAKIDDKTIIPLLLWLRLHKEEFKDEMKVIIKVLCRNYHQITDASKRDAYANELKNYCKDLNIDEKFIDKQLKTAKINSPENERIASVSKAQEDGKEKEQDVKKVRYQEMDSNQASSKERKKKRFSIGFSESISTKSENKIENPLLKLNGLNSSGNHSSPSAFFNEQERKQAKLKKGKDLLKPGEPEFKP